MFCNKSSHDAMDRVYKRALRVVYGTVNGNLGDLLQNNLPSIHERHLRSLLCEIYQSLNGLNTPISQGLFEKKEQPYSLRVRNIVTIPKTKTTRYGTESFAFRGSLLWNAMPDDIKNVDSIQLFKTALKKTNLERICSCKLCS